MNQEIRLDQPREVFVHEPVAGIPTAPIAVTVHAPNGAIENATIGDVSSDRLASRLAEDAVIGAPWLTLFNTAGVTIGRRYLVGEAPHSEWVVVTDIQGPRILVRRRLGREFSAGSMFRSGRLSIAVNPVWQRAQARQVELGGIGLSACTLRWSYAIDGRITHAIDHADLVFTPRADVVTPEEIELRYSGWTQTLPSEHSASDVILEAHDLVRRDAACANVDLNNAVETRELVALRARMIAIEQEVLYGRVPSAELDAEQSRYQRRAAELWKTLHRPPTIARGAPKPSPPKPPPISRGATKPSPPDDPPISRGATKPSPPDDPPISRDATKLLLTDDPVLDLRRWLETSRANNVTQWKQLQLLQERWLSRFESSDELREAVRLIRQFINSRGLREMREAVVRELERRRSAAARR